MAREYRVGTALERLVASGVISAEQRTAIVRAVDERERARRAPAGRVIAEIVAYLGAGLVAAGLVLFLDRAWIEIARTGRVVLLVVVAGCAIGGAVVLADGWRGVFRRVPIASAGRVRLAAVLLALAAGAVTGAVATAFDTRGPDWAAPIAGLLVAVFGYLLVPSLLGMVVVAVFGVASIVEVTSGVFVARSPWQGIALLAFGAVWFALAAARLLVLDWAGYLIGGIVAVIGAQSVTLGESLWRPLLTGLIGVLCLAFHLFRREAVLVLGGATAVAIAVGQLVADYTDGGPAVASAVLGVGTVVLTVGVLVLNTRSEPRQPD
ncbi:DUF2157 domain-containing protein [Nocardia sp. NPDC058176]|uniref:DUF2157 domain-containing protein n=1 Tax=Nocardia sp. NPDC058176 TaxID=3346368 RepID=UPI0036D91A69